MDGRLFPRATRLILPLPARRNASTENGRMEGAHAGSPENDTPATVYEDADSMQMGAHDEPGSSGVYSERVRTHEFDTYNLVLALQSAGYSQAQAVALMKCLRTVLISGTEFAKSHYLSRGDLENVRYSYFIVG
jgi:hypothetical protein